MKDTAQRIMEAFYKDETWDKEPLPDKIVVANVLREVVMEVVLPYMQYAEWEIVHKIMEDINKVADEIEDL
jgi:hypothetical protein